MELTTTLIKLAIPIIVSIIAWALEDYHQFD
jgi:hypothetical protein